MKRNTVGYKKVIHTWADAVTRRHRTAQGAPQCNATHTTTHPVWMNQLKTHLLTKKFVL